MQNSLHGVKFSLYGEEVSDISAVEVTNASTYDRGQPKHDGLMDSRMGVFDRQQTCATCGISSCDHHYGHITLAVPVLRYISIQIIINVLRSVCCCCGTFKGRPDEFKNCKLLYKERTRYIADICNTRQCKSCHAPQPKFRKTNKLYITREYKEVDLDSMEEEEKQWAQKRFTPYDVQLILQSISVDTWILLGFNPEVSNPVNLVIQKLLIPPPNIRPFQGAGGNDVKNKRDNDLTVAFQEIIRINTDILELKKKDCEELYEQWDMLQLAVSSLTNHGLKRDVDIKGNSTSQARSNAKKTTIDMKRRLCGKRGRLRGNLCGRRVDHSSRTVLGSDTSHDIWCLGVPSAIMNTLTFPERVNRYTYTDLKNRIKNGFNCTDGAATIIEEDGTHRDLSMVNTVEARESLSERLQLGWIVERHLRNGDWVLFNRQPSLHKESINAFKIYRVDSMQFKLPLPLTTAYNADFDGDEMVLHALQSYQAVAEAQELLSVPNHMVTAQSSGVLTAVVQDGLDGLYSLSQCTSIPKDVCMQLLLCIHYDTVQTYGQYCEPNATHSIDTALTGHELVSYLFPPTFNLVKNGVIIRNGKMLEGKLCKKTVGRSSGGIVHRLWKDYGPWAAAKFVSDAQRLSCYWLLENSPSISIQDCLLQKKATIDLRSMIHDGVEQSTEQTTESAQMEVLQQTLQRIGKFVTESIPSTSGTATVTACGAKGNMLNITQICGIVGQQTVNGLRVQPKSGISGKRTLPNFAPNDLSPLARGFVKSNYLQGLSPHEVFFSQMGGREGIVATAVNTAESGYGQRRMVKGQESQTIVYDGSVRVSNQNIVQPHYGMDDYDASKLELVMHSSLPTVYTTEWAQYAYSQLQCESYLLPFNISVLMQLCSGYTQASKESIVLEMLTTMHQLHADFQCQSRPFHFLSVQDALTRDSISLLELDDPSYISRCVLCCLMDSVDTSTIQKDQFLYLFRHTYKNALVNQGEGVGAIGATSIGEPATQMVLNTFHYAGNAATNVTINGLPRAKELITASDSSATANMTILTDKEYALEPLFLASVGMKATIRPTYSSPFSLLLGSIPGSHDHSLLQGDIISKTAAMSTIPRSLLLRKFQKDQSEYTECSVLLDIEVDSPIPLGILQRALGHSILVCDISPRHYEIRATSLESIGVSDSIRMAAIVEVLHTKPIAGIESIQKAIRTPTGYVTVGSSMEAIAKLGVTMKTTYSNNVQEIVRVLGIEAGVYMLQQELIKVLNFNDAYVSPRHSLLLADTMGRTGVLCGMVRQKMAELGNGVLHQASFEQTMDVLEGAAIYGITDSLSGVTEKNIVGQPICVGTGCFDILQDDTQDQRHKIIGRYIPEKMDEEKEMDDIQTTKFRQVLQILRKNIYVFAREEVECKISYDISEEEFCGKTSYTTETHVSFLLDDSPAYSLITYAPSVQTTSYSTRSIHVSTEDGKDYTLTGHLQLRPEEIPVAVQPTHVMSRQVHTQITKYWKKSWIRQWTGRTNMEAEEAFQSRQFSYLVEIVMLNNIKVLEKHATIKTVEHALHSLL